MTPLTAALDTARFEKSLADLPPSPTAYNYRTAAVREHDRPATSEAEADDNMARTSARYRERV